MHLLILHGPNLNLLGQRDPAKYGTLTLAEIDRALTEQAAALGASVTCFQSNHEGALIDFLQLPESRQAAGAVVNPGALIRYAYSFRQALIDFGKPVVEVHMSDIHATGINKSVNVLEDVRVAQVVGLREGSYYEGLRQLVAYVGSGK